MKIIKCKCGKYYGARNMRRTCKRCNTIVMDRLEDTARKKMKKAKAKRDEKKITDKVGFEYKDRKKVW